MKRAYERAPYYSMGTMPPASPAPKPAAPAAAPAPAPAPASGDATQQMSPELAEKMRKRVEEIRMQKQMDDAYNKAAPRSMELGLAKGGSVSSASSRADGVAQRGKTKGRMV